MTTLHLTIDGFDASVAVSDDQLAAVQERVDAAYADLLTDLTNLGMVVDVKRAERWTAFVEREVPDYGCGDCRGGSHTACTGTARIDGGYVPCNCATRNHERP